MKTYFLRVLMLTAITSITACKKTEQKPLVDRLRETDSGILTVKLNGKDWNDGVVHAYYNYYYSYSNPNGRFNIALEAFEGSVKTGTLMLSNIDPHRSNNPVIVGSYYGQHPDSTTANYTTGGSDYIDLQFDVKTPGGYVAIDSYDGSSVTGRFELTLVRNPFASSSLPDTLRFTDGNFNLRIY